MDNYETGIYTDNPDDTLRYMQSAEVVEVVRCKDCKHWETAYDADKAEYGLCYGHKFSIFVTSADGYYYRGERRNK